MLLALTNLFISIVLAASKTEPAVTTNFLTEDDLNRAFVKLVSIIAVPVLLQIFLAWKESRSGVAKEVREVKELLLKYVPEVENIKKDYVTHDRAKYLARQEAYDVVDRHVRKP